MRLSVRERILMIRLLEKIKKHPGYAETLGIEATGAANRQNNEKTEGPHRYVRPFVQN